MKGVGAGGCGEKHQKIGRLPRWGGPTMPLIAFIAFLPQARDLSSQHHALIVEQFAALTQATPPGLPKVDPRQAHYRHQDHEADNPVHAVTASEIALLRRERRLRPV